MSAIDKTKISITTLAQSEEEDVQYWAQCSPIERLQALEINRQIIYGYDPSTTRLQRILEIAPFPSGGRHKDLDDLEHLSKKD